MSRDRKRTRPRGVTFALHRTAAFVALFGDPIEAPIVERPRTRRDCLPGGCNEQRPCPFVVCRHHLYLEVNPNNGSLKINFRDVAPDQLDRLVDTCELDVADRGALTLEAVGERLNLTRERVAQLERAALAEYAAKGGE